MGVALVCLVFFIGVFVLYIVRRKCVSNNVYKILIKKVGFTIGYYLYSNTRLGCWFFKRELNKARQKHGGRPHSKTESWLSNGIIIQPIPFSDDNYCYLIIDEKSLISVLIDPADPEAIQPVLDANQVCPVAILSTHKHWDHSGGNEEWKRRYPRVKVFGGANESVPAATNFVSHEDQLTFGRLHITALLTPGHTSGHVVYLLDVIGSSPSLFSGDLLFVGGAGKMFEGSSETMLKSLDVVSNLPNDTLLWPGHEYALSNMRFSSHLEPLNQNVRSKLQEVEEKRKNHVCVIPTTIGAEKMYNPFLRTGESSLLAALEIGSESTGSPYPSDKLRATALGECRARKDVFKYTG